MKLGLSGGLTKATIRSPLTPLFLLTALALGRSRDIAHRRFPPVLPRSVQSDDVADRRLAVT